MRYFRPAGRPAHPHLDEAPQPIGAACVHCDEAVGPDDDGVVYANGPIAHFECFMRRIVGSVNHQLRRCSCYGGDGPDEPPELTRRESARLALALWERRPR